ncbi:MAG: T9SS type A sorting domain-containing protein [Ignavibacterium sp.]|nr:T9SS type A sorting domain-containing protein [Ignavibacterium sp.]
MKKLFILFSVVLSFQITSLAQDGWFNVTPSDTVPRLLGVYALDANNIWVTGVDGTILHTIDGGLSWVSIQSNISVGLGKVQFINPDTGWVASSHYIYRTTDGGSSWVQQLYLPNSSDIITDVEFVKGLPGEQVWGYATGGLQSFWKTTDCGETWISNGGACGNGNFNACSFVDKNTGWIVGVPSVSTTASIMRTTDGGGIFEEQINPVSEPYLRDVIFIDSQRGLTVGIYGQTLFTSDGGANWEQRPNGSKTWMRVFLTASGKAWSIGFDGAIAHSNDWGYNWQNQESGVNDLLWGIHFINDNEGWVVGQISSQKGVILNTTNGGVTFVEEEKIYELPTTYSLSNNFPNPFNPTTTIKWQIPEIGFVTLKIYDVLGSEVAALVNEEKPAGEFEVEFNVGRDSSPDIASGIYFYQIKAGDFIQTKKMIFIK